MSDFPVIVPYHKRPSWFWWTIFIGAPLALGFGTFGFWLYDKKPAGVTPWFDALYHSLQLFILHTPHLERPANWCLELGRWLAAGIFGMAALIALYDIVMREIEHFRLRFAHKHSVICGQGPKVIELVRCFAAQNIGKDEDKNKGENQFQDKEHLVVVIIPPEEDSAPYHSAGAIVIVGNPTHSAILARARIQTANQVIALYGDDNTNVQVAVEAGKFVQRRAPQRLDPLKCFVHLADVDLRASLHRTAVFGDQSCKVHFFDLFDAAARGLLLAPIHMDADSYFIPLDHGGVLKADPRVVHLVLLGFGRMGRTVAVRAAQLGHFANGKPIHISVIDQEADRHKEMLLFRYPSFEKTCNIEFHNMGVETKKARDLLENWCAAKDSITSIAVCFNQDSLALEVALRLFPKLRQFDIPVAVRMSHKSGFASLLEEGRAHPEIHFQIRGFGMLEDTCREDVLENPLNETLARAIHEDFCRKQIEKGRDQSDPSVQPWENLNDDFKDSNRQQADHIGIKLQGIGCVRAKFDDPRPAVEKFTPEEIETMAKMEHSRWNAERLLAGWTQGPRRDSSRKTSPYIAPWEVLPPDIQENDRDAVRLIPELLKNLKDKGKVCRK